MLRYLPHHEINEKSWNDCVAASAEKIIYAFSWYLDVVCQKWGAIVEEKEGRYVSVFPLPLHNRLGQNGILQPYYTQQLGLFTTSQSRCKSIKSYLGLIPANYKSVYLQLNSFNSKNQIKADGFGSEERVTYHLSLQPKYEELLKHYRNKHKLSKAKRSGLQVKSLQSISPLINLFKQTKGKELSEMKEKHYSLLSNLYNTLSKYKAVELLQVVNENKEPVGAAMFVHQPDKIIYLFSGASEEGRNKAAMTLLLDCIIQKYAGSNRILDFEGSMVPSVAKFYANFGATPVTYVSLTRQHIPWYLLWKKAISSS